LFFSRFGPVQPVKIPPMILDIVHGSRENALSDGNNPSL
jgi:hypothetical protein